MNDKPNEPSGSPHPDTKYLVIVGALLVLIIAVLAVLWRKERCARADGERRLSELTRSPALPTELQRILAGRRTMPPPEDEFPKPVQREDLPGETLQFKGRLRTVLYISPDAGRRFGFRGGDVIVVGGGPEATPDTDTSEP
jgi:hypothetical protein